MFILNYMTDKCPDGFNLLNNTGCYSVILQLLTWNDARAKCEALLPNSRLAIIQNEAQNCAITSDFRSLLNDSRM